MAHARCKLEHAKDNDPALATEALVLFQQLYEIERDVREQGLTHDEIKLLRQEKSAPILLEMETWLNDKLNKVLPKSAIGQAIAYTLTLWPRLIRYIDEGRFIIDNNLIENSIRPVAPGRKNYMFAGSHSLPRFFGDAAQQAAIVNSLLATCEINNIDLLSGSLKRCRLYLTTPQTNCTNFCQGKSSPRPSVLLRCSSPEAYG